MPRASPKRLLDLLNNVDELLELALVELSQWEVPEGSDPPEFAAVVKVCQEIKTKTKGLL